MKKFQFYPANIQSNRPIDFITLPQFMMQTMNPNERIKQVFKTIERAALAGDMEKKARMKQNYLHYFTPCVHIDGYRRYANIKSFTGLAVLDFDKIDNAIEFKSFLFFEYRQIIAVWLSPSKRGIKALVNIPIVNSVDVFKEYFFGIANEMEIYDGFDATAQNAVLPLFQSWDANLMYREAADLWLEKGIKNNDFNFNEPVEYRNITVTDKHTLRVVNIIKSGINKITDVGHWDLRGTALAAGGFVAAGYMSEMDAIGLMDNLVDSHPYLRIKANTYKKTIRWGVNVGQNKPLYL